MTIKILAPNSDELISPEAAKAYFSERANKLDGTSSTPNGDNYTLDSVLDNGSNALSLASGERLSAVQNVTKSTPRTKQMF